jgi:hypothetical protein
MVNCSEFNPSSDGFVGRSPEEKRAGLGAARRSARPEIVTVAGVE